MGLLLDATFLVDVLRGEPAALAKARELDGRREPRLLSSLTIYEVSAGILFRRSKADMLAFQALAAQFETLDLLASDARKAAEIQAELMRTGRMKGHMDVLVAGIASARGHVVVTRDADFRQMADVIGLKVETY